MEFLCTWYDINYLADWLQILVCVAIYSMTSVPSMTHWLQWIACGPHGRRGQLVRERVVLAMALAYKTDFEVFWRMRNMVDRLAQEISTKASYATRWPALPVSLPCLLVSQINIVSFNKKPLPISLSYILIPQNLYGAFAFSLLVDCEWMAWSDWSTCTMTCGIGTGTGQQTRIRSIITHEKHGGTACSGSLAEHQLCNQDACPPGEFF